MPSFRPMRPARGIVAYWSLISTSTPAARSSLPRASIVCCVGSRMSSSRLWVRISNCSRDFLSTCGERLTVKRSMWVGSGIGPATRPPVRRTVSTISRTDWSSSRWSYALRRMRILSFTRLLEDLGDHASADRPPALADGEAQALVHGDGGDEVDLQLHVVAGHHHFRALGQRAHAGHVGGAEVELRPVAVEEGRVPPALLLGEHVGLGLELGVRGDRARLGKHLAALDLLALGAAQEAADVVARDALVEQLAEHLDAGDDGLGGRLDADDLDLLADLDLAALDAAGGDRAAGADREHVLDRHEEGLFDLALGFRDVGVHGVHQLLDRARAEVARVALEGLQRAAADDGDIVAGELVL